MFPQMAQVGDLRQREDLRQRHSFSTSSDSQNTNVFSLQTL